MQTGREMSSMAVAGTEKSAVLIANPTSGSYFQNARQIVETINYLRRNGWQADLQLTRAEGDARRITREAVEKEIAVVVAVGGDGTINEVIQELAGSETALGVLPSGTVNVWAREVGIPLDNAGARDVLLHGEIRTIDLGKINDRYFLLMAGLGLDGEVTHAVEKKPIKRLGVLGYLLIGTWLGLGYQAFRVLLELRGRVIKLNALQIIVGNTQLYAGALKYTWLAKCDDGLLDVCIVRKRGILGRVMIVIDFLLRRKQRQQWVRYETGNTIKIRTRHPVAIQIDGEPFGHTPKGEPIIFTVARHALKVIVPYQTTAEIFSTGIV
jgi:diacylglycerol kinase (ATP)